MKRMKKIKFNPMAVQKRICAHPKVPETVNSFLKPYRSERGSALVMAAIFMIVASGLIIAAARMIADSSKQSKQQEVSLAEAENVARAGLVDGINWFRRTKVVATGNPIVSPYTYFDQAFSPTVNATAKDTLDTSIGIVNEYSIDNAKQLWARYEVRKQLDPTGTPTLTQVDPNAAHDLTDQRVPGHLAGEGLDWQMVSVGIVFKRLDTALPYNQYPNQVLANVRMSTEVRKMGLSLPAKAAAIATNMPSIISRSRGRINGAGSGIFCAAAVSGSAPVTAGCPGACGQFFGPLNGVSLAAASVSEVSVFGLPGPQDVKNLADFIGSAAKPFAFQGSYKLAYYEGDVAYTTASSGPLSQLIGSGILYVNGNLALGDGTNSSFDGLIYATGAVTIGITCQVLGCVMGRNGVVVGTSSGAALDNANLYYDQTRVNNAQQLVATYRENRAATRSNQAMP